ncbi:fam-c protein [Plasmodium vinckei brucechwatti]|uniref:Fam-c protein n=1 Tax=Plasmodium vinckei brucechwatti TaxID=119398 RepID=A0A6V7S5H7_PLAVN|nr:fam-c protein [Plasmodium vinckei brucechwatti]
MNKRILSLVCIALYTLLSVSIYCSQQKVPNVGNKNVRGIKEGNIRNEKNSIEFKNYNISERDIQAKLNSYIALNIYMGIKKMTAALNDYIAKNPEALKFVLLLKQELKQLPNDKKYPFVITVSMENIIQEFPINDPKDLKILLRIIEDLDNPHQLISN